MQLRITGGKLKGKTIFQKHKIVVRPTSSKIRESIFNRLTNNIHTKNKKSISDFNFIDVFSGTGIIGFEALSREFEHVTFFEKNELLTKSIYKNAQNLELNNKIEIFCVDATKPPKGQSENNILYFDPPYNSDLLIPSLISFEKRGWINDKSIIFLETGLKDAIDFPETFSLIDVRKYGSTMISTIKKD